MASWHHACEADFMREQREWANQLIAQHDEDSVEGHYVPLLAPEKPAFRMTAKMWAAYDRGERYCPRCKYECDNKNEEGCPTCGIPLYGRAAW